MVNTQGLIESHFGRTWATLGGLAGSSVSTPGHPLDDWDDFNVIFSLTEYASHSHPDHGSIDDFASFFGSRFFS